MLIARRDRRRRGRPREVKRTIAERGFAADSGVGSSSFGHGFGSGEWIRDNASATVLDTPGMCVSETSAQSARAVSRAISHTITLSDADDVEREASAERLPWLSDRTPTASRYVNNGRHNRSATRIARDSQTVVNADSPIRARKRLRSQGCNSSEK